MILESGASRLVWPGQGRFGSLVGLVLARPAVSVKAGMPRWIAWLRRAVICSIWASLAGAGEADFQSFGLSEPAAGLGFGDAGDEVVADLDQAVPGGWVWPQERAAQAPLTELTLVFGQVAACFRVRLASLSA